MSDEDSVSSVSSLEPSHVDPPPESDTHENDKSSASIDVPPPPASQSQSAASLLSDETAPPPPDEDGAEEPYDEIEEELEDEQEEEEDTEPGRVHERSSPRFMGRRMSVEQIELFAAVSSTMQQIGALESNINQGKEERLSKLGATPSSDPVSAGEDEPGAPDEDPALQRFQSAKKRNSKTRQHSRRMSAAEVEIVRSSSGEALAQAAEVLQDEKALSDPNAALGNAPIVETIVQASEAEAKKLRKEKRKVKKQLNPLQTPPGRRGSQTSAGAARQKALEMTEAERGDEDENEFKESLIAQFAGSFLADMTQQSIFQAAFVRAAEERKAKERREADMAAVKLQAAWRGTNTRKKVRQHVENAATKVQSAWRGKRARQRVKQEKKEINDAAATLQTHFRKWRARKQEKEVSAAPEAPGGSKEWEPRAASAQTLENMMLEADHAATTLQAAWRGSKARKERKRRIEMDAARAQATARDTGPGAVASTASVNQKRQLFRVLDKNHDNRVVLSELKDALREMNPSTVTYWFQQMDRDSKGYIGEQEFIDGFDTLTGLAAQTVRAALLLQAAWRGRHARKSLKGSRASQQPRVEEKPAARVEEDAAVRVQSLWRGRYARKQVQEENAKVSKLQAQWRAKKQRQQFYEEKRAAVSLQSLWRGKQARDTTRQLKQQREEEAARLQRTKKPQQGRPSRPEAAEELESERDFVSTPTQRERELRLMYKQLRETVDMQSIAMQSLKDLLKEQGLQLATLRLELNEKKAEVEEARRETANLKQYIGHAEAMHKTEESQSVRGVQRMEQELKESLRQLDAERSEAARLRGQLELLISARVRGARHEAAHANLALGITSGGTSLAGHVASPRDGGEDDEPTVHGVSLKDIAAAYNSYDRPEAADSSAAIERSSDERGDHGTGPKRRNSSHYRTTTVDIDYRDSEPEERPGHQQHQPQPRQQQQARQPQQRQVAEVRQQARRAPVQKVPRPQYVDPPEETEDSLFPCRVS